MSGYFAAKNYIKENRKTYTSEAITEELLNQGYLAKDVEDAWKSILEEEQRLANPPVRGRSLLRRWEFWKYLLGFLFGMPLVAGIFGSIFFSSKNYGLVSFYVVVIVALVAFIGGLVIYFKEKRAKPIASAGLLVGMLLSVVLPFIPFFIIFGICAVTAGGR